MEIIKLMTMVLVISGFLIQFSSSREYKKQAKFIVTKTIAENNYQTSSETIDDIINEAADRWGIHRNILHGIAEIESSKNANIGAVNETNKTRSYGLFQINDVLAQDERVSPDELIRDVKLNAHLAGKKIGHYCKARIKKEKSLKGKLDAAYGCYRGAKKDEKLYRQLKKSGKLETIKNVLGEGIC